MLQAFCRKLSPAKEKNSPLVDLLPQTAASRRHGRRVGLSGGLLRQAMCRCWSTRKCHDSREAPSSSILCAGILFLFDLSMVCVNHAPRSLHGRHSYRCHGKPQRTSVESRVPGTRLTTSAGVTEAWIDTRDGIFIAGCTPKDILSVEASASTA